MWDFKIGWSLSLMGQTLPFILLRLVVYFGITLAYFVVTGLGAGIGWGIGGFGDEGFRASSTFWGGLIGFGLTAAVLYWLREYILYMVKAGHIAVLVELMDGEDLPAGRSQIEHAQAVVRERFMTASVLFAVDQLVKGVIAAITGILGFITSVIPIPGAQQIVGLLRAFLRVAVGFVDEIMLAYIIRTRADNPWRAAQEALVLYGQNAAVLLRNAAWLAVIIYVLSFVVFLLALAPAAAFVYFFPGGWSAAGVVFALLLAWSVKAAVLEPFAIACLMQVYFRVIEGQTPDPEWDAKLSGLSRKFREIKDRAVGADRPQGQAPLGPVAPRA